MAEASSSAALPSFFYVKVVPGQGAAGVSREGGLFTRANIAAWEKFATSPTAVATAQASSGDLFADMMSTAFKDELTFDPRLKPELYVPPRPTPLAPTCSAAASRNADGDPNRILLGGSCTSPFTHLTIPTPSGLMFTNFDAPRGASCTLMPAAFDCGWAVPASSFSGLKIELNMPPRAGEQTQLNLLVPGSTVEPDRVTIG